MSWHPPVVLFLCVHNAGRSQMAAALLARHGEDKVVIRSAGSDPGESLNLAVVAAMAELGIDISAEGPKKLTDEMAQEADVIVTMGCGDSCPVHPGKRYVDWELPDPAGRPIEEVRPIREEIDAKVRALLAELARTGNGLGKTSWLWRSDALTQRNGRRSVPFVCGRFKIRQIPSSSYAEEVERPDDWWVDGMKRLAWFVAEEAGETMGVIAGMPLEDTPEVVSMWMDPEHRGTGVADGLLAAVVAWAEVEDAAGLCLAVAESNHRARRFYERAGFVATSPGEAMRSRPDVCTTEMRLDFTGRIG